MKIELEKEIPSRNEAITIELFIIYSTVGSDS